MDTRTTETTKEYNSPGREQKGIGIGILEMLHYTNGVRPGSTESGAEAPKHVSPIANDRDRKPI